MRAEDGEGENTLRSGVAVYFTRWLSPNACEPNINSSHLTAPISPVAQQAGRLKFKFKTGYIPR